MSSAQHEPTMEEILASIRKIISEDNSEPTQAASKPAPVPSPVSDQADTEVLELTEEVAEPAVPESDPKPVAPEPLKAEVPTEVKTDEVVFEPIPAPEPATDSGIFSDHTRRAMEDTFDSISDDPGESEPTPPLHEPVPPDGASVESVFERAIRESFQPVLARYLEDNSQLVIEHMKPLIREWMDENFPALLENAVRGEVARIVKARTRR